MCDAVEQGLLHWLLVKELATRASDDDADSFADDAEPGAGDLLVSA